MSGFIEGTDGGQMTLFPDRLEDWISSAVRFCKTAVETPDPVMATRYAIRGRRGARSQPLVCRSILGRGR
jgi:hypothetical protein